MVTRNCRSPLSRASDAMLAETPRRSTRQGHARPQSLRWLRGLQRRTQGMSLPRCSLVLKQLIMDELDSRPVKPELLYEFVSMVLSTPNAQLVGLTVDAFQPLVHLEHLA